MKSRRIRHLAGELFGVLLAGAIFFLWATGVQLLVTGRPIPLASVAVAVLMLAGAFALLTSRWGKAPVKSRTTLAIALFVASLLTLPFMRAGLAFFSHQRIDWLSFVVSTFALITIPILGVSYFFGRGDSNRSAPE